MCVCVHVCVRHFIQLKGRVEVKELDLCHLIEACPKSPPERLGICTRQEASDGQRDDCH